MDLVGVGDLLKNGDNPSISSSQKRASRCYFCYLAQKHTCTLALVALIATLHYTIEIVTAVIKMSSGKP